MAKIRVGIIGASIDRGFASTAHIPALKALEDFELTAVCTTRQSSADAIAGHFEIPNAYGSAEAMIADAPTDLIVICVKTPEHHALAIRAIAAGKDVFSEWPLGATLAQAVEIEANAEERGICHMIGLQSRVLPAVSYVKDLVAQGYVGRVLSATLFSAWPAWGSIVTAANAYYLDTANGATVLSIPTAHCLDAFQHMVGPLETFSAFTAAPIATATVQETGKVLPMTATQQVQVSGLTADGAMASVTVIGGTRNGTGLRVEINGTHGDIAMTSHSRVGITEDGIVVQGSQGGAPLQEHAIPASYRDLPPAIATGRAVGTALLYKHFAKARREGNSITPDFRAALGLHRLLDKIERAARTGQRVRVDV